MMTNNGGTNKALALSSWGEAAPEWVIVLAEASDGKSQSAVARDLGVSSAMVNQAMRNTYPGRLDKLEQRVRGTLMSECVTCPVLGEITRRRCVDEQGKPPIRTNPLRVELRRACARCGNNLKRAA